MDSENTQEFKEIIEETVVNETSAEITPSAEPEETVLAEGVPVKKKKVAANGGKKKTQSRAKKKPAKVVAAADEEGGAGENTAKPKRKRTVRKVGAKAGIAPDGGPDWVLPDTVRVTVKPKEDEGVAMFLPSGTEEGVAQSFQGAQVQVGQETATLNRVVVQPVEDVTVLPQRAIKVRNIVGEIRDVTSDIITDKVIVQGTLHLQLFFVMTDGLTHHQAEDIPFSTFIDIPGATKDMNVQVHPRIEAILHHLSEDGLTIQKKAVLEIFVKVSQETQVSPEPGSGPLLYLRRVVGEGVQQTLVENIVDLNFPAVKVDEIHGELRDITADVIQDKVIIQGVVHKQIFLVDTDNLSRHQGEDVNFSLFIDVPGASPGDEVQVHPRIEGIFFDLLSPTRLRQKVVVEVFVKVSEAIQENVLVGDGPLFKVEQVVAAESKQTLRESVVNLDLPAEKVREITGEIRNATAEIIPNKVVVQGILHKQIFFIGLNDSVEHHQAEDVPFSLFIDMPGISPGQNVHVTFIIEEILFHLENDQTLRQKAIIKAEVVVTETIQISLALTSGPLFKLEQVIGEGIRQILITRRQPVVPVPPVPPFPVAQVTEIQIIQLEQVCRSQQIIIENQLELPEAAIKVREVRGQIDELTARIIPSDGVLVEGILEKAVFFVNQENIVKTVDERIPFSILVPFPGLAADTPISANVEIETILFTLDESGEQLRQVIVLRATVCTEAAAGQPVTVISDVTGEGIVKQAIQVRANLFNPVTGEILPNQIVQVLTDVSGPQVLRVEKQTLLLDVVNDGNPNPVPVEVVTRVDLRPIPL